MNRADKTRTIPEAVAQPFAGHTKAAAAGKKRSIFAVDQLAIGYVCVCDSNPKAKLESNSEAPAINGNRTGRCGASARSFYANPAAASKTITHLAGVKVESF